MGTIKKICGVILIISGLVMVFNGATNINKINEYNNIEKDEIINNEDNSNKEIAIDFTLKDQYGNEHTLSKYRGKTIFLNFWGTWCPPCRGEMHILKKYIMSMGRIVIIL